MYVELILSCSFDGNVFVGSTGVLLLEDWWVQTVVKVTRRGADHDPCGV